MKVLRLIVAMVTIASLLVMPATSVANTDSVSNGDAEESDDLSLAEAAIARGLAEEEELEEGAFGNFLFLGALMAIIAMIFFIEEDPHPPVPVALPRGPSPMPQN